MNEKGTTTAYFSVAGNDLDLLERLANHYAGGDRSEFLRIAMKRMERDWIVQRLTETRKQIDKDLGGKVIGRDEVEGLIKKVQES